MFQTEARTRKNLPPTMKAIVLPTYGPPAFKTFKPIHWKRRREVRRLENAWLDAPLTLTAEKRPRPKHGAKAVGCYYERKCHDALDKSFPSRLSTVAPVYFRSPCFRYVAGTFSHATKLRTKVCYPDGLIINTRDDEVIIIEVKLRHTPDAYYQMKLQYKPVVEKAFNKPCRMLSIVRWYSTRICYPEKYVLVPSVDAFIDSVEQIGVFIWSGR